MGLAFKILNTAPEAKGLYKRMDISVGQAEDKRGLFDLHYPPGRTPMPNRTEKITIRLPSRFVEALDLLVGVDDFPSRSEAIRTAVRDLVYLRAGLVMKKAKKLGRLQRDVTRLRDVELKYLGK